ncbi:nucleoside hydrolase [Novosphingobium humi]|uniref:Nucleoside hydrolase n=1 Tax=Novosphingobium humi TaxID=2282397 RepID=A0ABY7U189_9SPHN|nr:nucleoside hydrolase [Novosphingobium humi]WCT79292.1 nucleoside hydrolase [Novosphingobium humi]
MDRRTFAVSTLTSLVGGAALAGGAALRAAPPMPARVILDNDFAGDPDGLFQLAHHVLCRAVSIPLIIGSHLPGGFSRGNEAREGEARAREVLSIMGLDKAHTVIAGAPAPIGARASWKPGEASAAIVREAMREDAQGPLIYAAGAGLTDLALAWLSEPRIGRRIRLVWIGGRPHHGLGLPGPKAGETEFNFSIDPVAAQVIFNESDIEIWQVPADVYSQMLFSNAELEELAATGPLGAYLKAKVDALPDMLAKIPGAPVLPASDVYVLGDSPLVTLTALLPPMRPDTTSSRYVVMPTPRLLDDGGYAPRAGGRPMRVYTQIDAGITFRDMMARFRIAARRAA